MIFRRGIFVTLCRKLSQGNFFVLCFRKLPVAKKIMDERGGYGVIKIFRRKLFVSICRKLPQGNILCCVSESFRLRKTLWITRGGIKIFRRKLSCLTVPKSSQGNPSVLCLRNFPAATKNLDRRTGGDIKIFRRKCFLFQSAEKFRKGTLLCCVSENSRWRKTQWIRRWGIKISRRRTFVSLCQKFSQLNLFVLRFRKLPVAKNSMDKKVVYQDFPSKNFCLTMPNSFVGEPFCAVFQKKSGSEKGYG